MNFATLPPPMPQPRLMRPALYCLLAVAGCVLLGEGANLLCPPARGQERPLLPDDQPRPAGAARNPAPPYRAAVGEVRITLSVRQNASQSPRFVMAYRTVEEPEVAPPDFQPPAEIEQYFAAAAQTAIDDINRITSLNEKQEAKLKLAAMGDLSRVIREARQVHAQFVNIAPRDQPQILAVLEELALLNAHLKEGVFRSESMFGRVLAISLSQEQTDQLVHAQFKLHLSGHAMRPVSAHLSSRIDTRPLKLTNQQRAQLAEVMLVHSRRLVEAILWWEPPQVIALLKSIDRDELAKFLEPCQIESIEQLTAEPVQLEFKEVAGVSRDP